MAAPGVAGQPKVLRMPFEIAETGFDPAQVSDIYSIAVLSNIFEPLYALDYLAKPALVRPLTAEALPAISDDGLTWTIRLQPRIRFQDDPAFKGRPRELTAHDYVYSFLRMIDPGLKGPHASQWLDLGIVGMAQRRAQALKSGRMSYEPLEGLRALDDHTLQIRLKAPRPRLLQLLAEPRFSSAVAREVVEAYGDNIMAHPVGTGPFRLGTWRRSSLIVLEKNPQFRDMRWASQPAADDVEGQRWNQQFGACKLPLVDRVEVSVMEASQPRFLAFMGGEIDVLVTPLDFVPMVMPRGKLAPHLSRKGVRARVYLNPDVVYSQFNMKDPVVGGLAPERVALRRAISLALDPQREIQLVRRGQAIPAQGPLQPHTYGFELQGRSSMAEFNVAKARALLDLYGYVDRDGDGWRDQPDGKPLVLEVATQPDSLSRQFDELWLKGMSDLGIRVTFLTGQWAEQLKMARAGKLMIWQLAQTASSPDSQDILELLYGPSAGSNNLAFFQLPEMDALYREALAMPDGPERAALISKAVRLANAYVPYKWQVHRIRTDLMQPWVRGFRRPMFGYNFWKYIDVSPSERRASP